MRYCPCNGLPFHGNLRFYALLTASFREIAPTAELTSHPKSAEYTGRGDFLFRDGVVQACFDTLDGD